VSAADPQCLKGKVKVFEKLPGEDPRVASGKAKANGRYKAKDANPDPGKYYSSTGQRKVGAITCLAAKSKPKRVG